MNSENLNFFTNNGFSISDVSENVDTHIYSPMEVNKIVSDYRFQVGTSTRYVSIADIVGYDTSFHGNSSNIFDSMDYFFDKYGTSYQKRSTQMLEYSKDDIIEVSDGYANNYLIKNNLAVAFSKKSKEILDNEINIREKEEQKLIDEYNLIKNKLNNKILDFKVKTGKEDKVFGTISSKQISDKLKDLGYKIDKKCIKVNTPISTLGITNIEVELHKSVKFNVKINLIK